MNAALSVQRMTNLLTAPYLRGAERLVISLGPDGNNGTGVVTYDFMEYRARYGSDPAQPKYVLIVKNKTGRGPLEVQVDFSFQGADRTALLEIPPQTLAGTSFAIPLPARADATLRLLRLRQRPVPLPGPGTENFEILALLGNIAKLAWAIGWEKDLIGQHLRDVQQQRRRNLAHGFSLDKLGEDLRVPRFPPREHSFDPETIALYHLNDAVAARGAVLDETTRFGSAGHPGVNAGAESFAVGKFGKAFRFPGPTGTGAITILNHPDFDLPRNRSLTVEAFVNVIPVDGPAPRVVVVKGQVNQAGTLTAAGWSLTIAGFRGIANNARWAIFDGSRLIEIFADFNLSDGRFHHLAGVLDRASQLARLVVDGEERASADVSPIGALTNAESIRIGRSAAGHSLSGVVDEIRLSKVARADFHPVLGEGDDAYRRRLGIFERWLLPTSGELLKAINSLVHINGQADSFFLIEKDRATTGAAKMVRILPVSVPPGQSIDRQGALLTTESAASGPPEDDRDFDPRFLLSHARPKVDYGPDPKHRLMQSITKRRLDALVDLIAAAPLDIPGNLIVDQAFDETRADLHCVGRALRLRHENLIPEKLAVLAHQAGFDFVRNDGNRIYASVAPGEKLEVAIEPRPPDQTPPAGIDVFMGKPIDLALAPASLPATGEIRWTLIPCGSAAARFITHPADGANVRTPITSRPRLRLIAEAPGEITVRVEYTLRRRVISGTRAIRVSIEDLPDNATIAADGRMNGSEAAAVGSPGEAVNPMYLITSNAAGVNYGADPNNKKMQIVLEKPFNALLKTGLASGLQVVKAFAPNDAGLHKAGRALLITHNAIPPERLGAAAHQAGFGFVRRQGAQIFCAVGPGSKIEIVHPASLAPLGDELVVGTPADLRARFDTLPGRGSFNWSLSEFGEGRGSFDFVLRPAVRFTPREPGLLSLNFTYVEEGPAGVFPYSFEIKLKPELEARNAIIPKHQYDLIMNILSFFHPIGVEILTGSIRSRVVEIEQDPLRAFPDYTYPDFRI
jgi:hypothetical protein